MSAKLEGPKSVQKKPLYMGSSIESLEALVKSETVNSHNIHRFAVVRCIIVFSNIHLF